MSEPARGGENWFFVREGRRLGPFDRGGLVAELLAQAAPESVLVWRTGLPAWTRAGALDEIRGELPPPLPGAMAGAVSLADLAARDPRPGVQPPPLPGEEIDEETEALEGSSGDETADPAPDGNGDGARRRRRRRSRPPKPHGSRLPRYVVPLVLLFVAVMIGLWFLLRRLNEAPPGQILQQGQLLPIGPRPAASRG
jgi:hypothetical protein